jgi:hypothetical protein
MRAVPFPEIRPARADDVSNAGGQDRKVIGWRRTCVGLAFAVAFSCLAQDGHPVAATTGGTTAASQEAAGATTDAKPASQQSANQQKAATADDERKKQISDESTQLLTMALALKAEVDKTNKDTLSLNVIRKADAIERLAKTVKDKMKQGSGPG